MTPISDQVKGQMISNEMKGSLMVWKLHEGRIPNTVRSDKIRNKISFWKYLLSLAKLITVSTVKTNKTLLVRVTWDVREVSFHKLAQSRLSQLALWTNQTQFSAKLSCQRKSGKMWLIQEWISIKSTLNLTHPRSTNLMHLLQGILRYNSATMTILWSQTWGKTIPCQKLKVATMTSIPSQKWARETRCRTFKVKKMGHTPTKCTSRALKTKSKSTLSTNQEKASQVRE